MVRTITDASDFKDTKIPNLTQLDTLLRCHICKDFLKIPVLTPCGHTFCSLCIREYINKSAKCPLCLSELRESMLRSEFLVNEMVECYSALRPSLLECLQIEKDQTPEVVEDSSLIEIDSDPDIEITDGIPEGSDDIQILETHNSKSKRVLKPQTQHKRIIPRKTRSTVEGMFSKPSRNSSTKLSNQQMAQCPICQEFYPLRILERSHLDECLSLQSLGKLPTSKKPTISKSQSSLTPSRVSFGNSKKVSSSVTHDRFTSNHKSKSSSSLGSSNVKKEEVSYVAKYMNSLTNSSQNQRLPKLDHATLSISQLRQKLASLNIPSTGSRQNLIERYAHYEILWNSNFCDSLNPVSESELKRQLASWEASHVPVSSIGRNTIGNLMKRGDNGYQKVMSNFRNDKFDRKLWTELFSKEFKRLIKEARVSIKKQREKHQYELKEISSIKNDESIEVLTDKTLEAPADKPITSTQSSESVTESTEGKIESEVEPPKPNPEVENQSTDDLDKLCTDDDLSRELSLHLAK